MNQDILTSTSVVKTSIKPATTSAPKYAGIHVIAEFWHSRIIEDTKEIEGILVNAAKKAKCNALSVASHKFSPAGITAFVLLSESHLSIHSWPELNYLAIDIFTCGRKTMPYQALEYLKDIYQPKKIEISEIKRGRIR